MEFSNVDENDRYMCPVHGKSICAGAKLTGTTVADMRIDACANFHAEFIFIVKHDLLLDSIQ